MVSSNPVFSLLYPAGNQALLAAGQPISALLNGQIGIFNANTSLAVDGSVPSECRKVFIAVGINRTIGGTAPAETVMKSTGQYIQPHGATSLTFKPTVDFVPKIVEITNYKAFCGQDYFLDVQFMNVQIAEVQGTNTASKPFGYQTAACQANCDDCASKVADPMEVAVGLVNSINDDADKRLVASLRVNSSTVTTNGAAADGTVVVGVGTETFNVPVTNGLSANAVAAKVAAIINGVSTSIYAASSNAAVIRVYNKLSGSTTPIPTVVSAATTGVAFSAPANTTADIASTDYGTFRSVNPTVAPIIRITGVADVRTMFSGPFNQKYTKPGTNFIVAFRGKFSETGTITVVQKMQYAEGSGYDLKQMEWMASGWGPNGAYAMEGFPALLKDSNTNANISANYNVFDLSYYLNSESETARYDASLLTYICVPCADAATLADLSAKLDLIFPQFKISDDTAGIVCSNTNVTTRNNALTDGIEISY